MLLLRLIGCRYLGGLVSAIDLLEYGFGPGGRGKGFDPKGLEAVRKQAEILVHKLAPGYIPPSIHPHRSPS